jgi:hypothetical protein
VEITINCLRELVRSGQTDYPIYVGLIAAKDILGVAEVPSFSHGTSHDAIATNILQPPVKDWQRPLDALRVDQIAQLFNDTGELMPNPVLLGENIFASKNVISIRSQMAPGQIPTNVLEVTIQVPAPDEQKPLWILDGQHRINGLAKSNQSGNVIPVVLLLNGGLNAYSPSTLAKLFGQVTTSAQKLDDLHNEWLTFAFHLQDYDQSNAKSSEFEKAMKAVAELCRRPQLLGVNNPFFNRIRFNSHQQEGGALQGGFDYSCIELKEIIRRYYYSCSAKGEPHLPPSAVAEQMGLAYVALTTVVTAPHEKTVFFGDAEHSQKIMQDAFLIGVLSYLLEHGSPTSWTDVLEMLKFKTTVWDFRTWVRTLSGGANAISKDLAIRVFKKMFQEKKLPPDAGNTADYLRGNNAAVSIMFSYTTSSGRRSQKDSIVLDVSGGAVRSMVIEGRRHVKIVNKTDNIGDLDVTDKQSPPGRLVFYDLKRGITLNAHSNPLQLLVTMHHYGGVEMSASVDIIWQAEA